MRASGGRERATAAGWVECGRLVASGGARSVNATGSALVQRRKNKAVELQLSPPSGRISSSSSPARRTRATSMSLKVNGAAAAPDAAAATLVDGQPAENEADNHPIVTGQPGPAAAGHQRQQQNQRHNKPIRLKNHSNCGEIYDTLNRLAAVSNAIPRLIIIFICLATCTGDVS